MEYRVLSSMARSVHQRVLRIQLLFQRGEQLRLTFGRSELQNQIISDKMPSMKMLTVTEAARNFSRVLDEVERDQEEIVLVRNRRHIVRLVPEPPAQDALAVLGDLYRTLDDQTADALLAAVNRTRKGKAATLAGLRNPWAS
jgi:antitoxin (DNA-binding transcriptional repressor) of toxin-antitoxin stability system